MAYADQVSGYYSAITSFYQGQANYLDSTGVPPTVVSLQGLDYADLQTYSVDESTNKPTFSAGTANEVVSEIFAVQRELSMALKSKSELIGDAVSEFQNEQVYRDGEGQYAFGVVKGSPTSGSTS